MLAFFGYSLILLIEKIIFNHSVEHSHNNDENEGVFNNDTDGELEIILEENENCKNKESKEIDIKVLKDLTNLNVDSDQHDKKEVLINLIETAKQEESNFRLKFEPMNANSIIPVSNYGSKKIKNRPSVPSSNNNIIVNNNETKNDIIKTISNYSKKSKKSKTSMSRVMTFMNDINNNCETLEEEKVENNFKNLISSTGNFASIAKSRCKIISL